MKTIEEKARAYDEALERGRKLKKTCDSTAVIGWCEYLFPELKENEDEKIRKELISLVENWKIYNPNSPFDECPIYTSDKETINKIIAWLEKQGEQKSAEDFNKKELIKIEDEPENYKQQIMSEINDVVEEYIDWLRSLKNKIDDKLVIQEAKKYYSDNINAFDAFLHGVEFAEGILAQKR